MAAANLGSTTSKAIVSLQGKRETKATDEVPGCVIQNCMEAKRFPTYNPRNAAFVGYVDFLKSKNSVMSGILGNLHQPMLCEQSGVKICTMEGFPKLFWRRRMLLRDDRQHKPRLFLAAAAAAAAAARARAARAAALAACRCARSAASAHTAALACCSSRSLLSAALRSMRSMATPA